MNTRKSEKFLVISARFLSYHRQSVRSVTLQQQRVQPASSSKAGNETPSLARNRFCCVFAVRYSHTGRHFFAHSRIDLFKTHNPQRLVKWLWSGLTRYVFYNAIKWTSDTFFLPLSAIISALVCAWLYPGHPSSSSARAELLPSGVV